MPSRAGLVRLALGLGLVVTGCSEPSGTNPVRTAPATTPAAAMSESPTERLTTEQLTTEGPTTERPTTEQPTTQQPTTQEADGEVSIAFVGDVMLGRSIGDRILAGTDPFAGVTAELTSADVVVGTLETTVGDGGQAEDKAYTFQAPPEAVEVLLQAGFDLVALANNHTYDYGAEGITGTIELLDAASLAHVGAGADAEAARRPVVLTTDGVDTAFLSYVDVPDDWTGYRNRDWEARDRPGVAWAHPDDIAADVREIRPDVDHVVVLLHAGIEGSTEPSAVQRAAADAALGAGATAVIGGHPHVLQGYRHEDGRFTAWSLGNFVFDGFGDDHAAQRSAILTMTLDEDRVTGIVWTPVAVTDGLPIALDPGSEEGRSVLDHLEALPPQR